MKDTPQMARIKLIPSPTEDGRRVILRAEPTRGLVERLRDLVRRASLRIDAGSRRPAR
jgi:hypothetical protein